MHKVKNCPLQLPRSVRTTIAKKSHAGATHNSPSDWLENFNNQFKMRSIFHKGPLMSIIPAISDLITLSNLLNIIISMKL